MTSERKVKIAFRNRQYLIADKPRGMPVHSTRDPNRANLFDEVRAIAGDPDELTLHHRLDVWTSGLVALSLSDAGSRALGVLFERREVDKRYLAVCVGRPDVARGSGELRHYLAKRRVDGKDRMLSVRSGGKVAIARFRLESYDAEHDLSVVEYELVTGRMHQLRVQSAEAGWPILGDPLYGDTEANRHSGWTASCCTPATSASMTRSTASLSRSPHPRRPSSPASCGNDPKGA